MDHRLNVKYKIIKVLENNLGENLKVLGLGDMTAKGLYIKVKRKTNLTSSKLERSLLCE